ncbi:hypothetical protein KAZ93_04865 [Patescibacteria group bacterium]|nr:hypothetical protein [Patescibacteria group bacterium]
MTDFNLMTTKGYMGSLKVEQISQEISGVLLSAFKTGIYVLDDSEVTIEIGSDTYTLSQGDFILIDGEENKEIKISSTENCKIALAEVFAPPSS